MTTGVLAIAFVVGCGGTTNVHADAKAMLSISPPTSTLTIVNDAPLMEAFTATLTYPDGTSRDATAETRFTIDSTFGAFDHQNLTMTVAGKTQVIGTWVDKTATAEVIARLKDIRIDPSLPANVGDWFNTPEDPSHAPVVVYPAPDVAMPRNVGDFEIHWTDASANDVYEVSLHTDFTDVYAYVPGTKVSPPPFPGAAYTAFLASE